MSRRLPRSSPLLALTAVLACGLGCNAILGTEAPQPLGSGGSGTTSTSTSTSSTSETTSTTTSTSATTSATTTSSSSTSSSMGGGGAGGSAPTVCGDASWTHWNPDAPRTFTPGGANQYVVDSLTGLTWEGYPSTSFGTLAEAQQRCATLSIETLTSGWRLPTRVELLSIIDFTKTSPAVDESLFHNTVGGPYWTTSQYVDFNGSTEPWTVWFGSGSTAGWSATDTAGTLCVLGPTIEGDPSCYRYEHTNGTAKDVETGLVWQRNAAQGQMTHAEAVSHCQNLSLEGGSFRLPRVEELATLIKEQPDDPKDPRYEGKAFPFASEPNGYYWAITDFAYSPASTGWSVGFYDGVITTSNKGDHNFVRCVSGP